MRYCKRGHAIEGDNLRTYVEKSTGKTVRRCRTCAKLNDLARQHKLRASQRASREKRKVNNLDELGYLPMKGWEVAAAEYEFHTSYFGGTTEEIAEWLGRDERAMIRDLKRAGIELPSAA